ncbi:MAG: hypothetical protein CL878_07925 [Dehalococcoidia bacterium]|nr:hypothetical protein [Dehalococcoidia bacterium]
MGRDFASNPRQVLSQLGALPRRPGDPLRVSYGHAGFPDPPPGLDTIVYGGPLKYSYLQQHWPHAGRHFDIIYAVSTSHRSDLERIARMAQRRGGKLVWNQNGVAYPAWHGPGWEQSNVPLSKALHAADHVLYQSNFCKLGADRFLGERNGPWEILYNAVDTTRFTPAEVDPAPGQLVLLLAGSHQQSYRLESAARAVEILARQSSDVRLLVTGRLSWTSDPSEATRSAHRLVAECGIADRVEFVGPYLQEDAPAMMRRAHVLLHTQYNDACPSVVIEAMACGLPVVYSHSGGTPELAGDDAGVGVPTELNWEQVVPPEPQALAEAVLQVAERRAQYAEAARQRAVEHFDFQLWLQRHREIFSELLS